MVVETRTTSAWARPQRLIALVSLFFAIAIQPVSAQALSIAPYAHSTLSSSETFSNEDYLVPNSVPKRINNQLRIEKELRVNVTGLKETYRVNDGHTTDQAFGHYLSKLKALNANILYQCASRDCGRSSSWAQNIFNNSKLYGEDASQFYLSAWLEKEGQQWLVSVYAIERGNRRVYAHVETLKLNSPLNSDLAASPSADKPTTFVFSYDLNGVVSVNPTLADINQIIELTRSVDNANVYILGHQQEGYSSANEALARSKEAADQVASLLRKRGVDSARITTLGLGPLVTYGSGAHIGNRVEVLVLSR
ncbi:DUF4892 domain-containing protein [Alkalimarinus sediminis]|uniref:DUF4892 domain-containing protein n=1 Tax=Alkalimarinus sediminis TaxID=1632866 RepID=A0A9E8KRG7_9ALTE|nr:DUF4892 domain-containing protein [Alkalimarinus sediminis]UZW76042.1 DUF4892 domain-containing protein [Alkalimarinus sediminis]